MTDVRELFGLTAEETCLLFSLQYQIVYKDTISTQDTNLNQKKKAWLDKWHESIKIYSKEQGIANVITDSRNLTNLVKKIQSSCSTKISFYLILLECTLFTPYFALDGQKKEDINIDKEKLKKEKENIALLLGIDKSYVSLFEEKYKSSIDSLTGFWTKVIFGSLFAAVLVAITAGILAPAIAALAAPAGIYGAAAIAAGLAALGGGAIAAGGLGIAGGIAVIVGGGAILGAVGGGTIGAMLASSPDFALSQSAKLEVVIREIIIGVQKDVRLAQEILLGVQATIANQEQEILKLKMKDKENRDKIANLEKSLKYLKDALERMTNIIN